MKIFSNVVTSKMLEAVSSYNENGSERLTVCRDISVARVVVNLKTIDKKSSCNKRSVKGRYLNNPSGVPFLCFIQRASSGKIVIYGLESGKTDIVDANAVSIKRKNLSTFSIKGVRYRLKNVINGLPRFVAQNNAAKSGALNPVGI